MYVVLYIVIGTTLAMGYVKSMGWGDEPIGNIGFFKFMFTFFGTSLFWPFHILVGLSAVFWAWVERNSNV